MVELDMDGPPVQSINLAPTIAFMIAPWRFYQTNNNCVAMLPAGLCSFNEIFTKTIL